MFTFNVDDIMQQHSPDTQKSNYYSIQHTERRVNSSDKSN